MPIRFNIYWLMIAVAILAVPMALYANYPVQTGNILILACVLCGPPCVGSLIATRRVVIWYRNRGHRLTRGEGVAFFIVFSLVAFMLWFLLSPIFFGLFLLILSSSSVYSY